MKNTTPTTPATKECGYCSNISGTDPCEFCGQGIECERCHCAIDEKNEGYIKWTLCRDCESARIDLGPKLIATLDELLDLTLDQDLASGNELTEEETEIREKALKLFAEAHGEAA